MLPLSSVGCDAFVPNPVLCELLPWADHSPSLVVELVKISYGWEGPLGDCRFSKANEGARTSPHPPPVSTSSLMGQGRLDTTFLARANLRELARQVEEIAVILEEAGYQTVPDELRQISQRLIDVRHALERSSGEAPTP